MNAFLCDYGNCENRGTLVTVSVSGSRCRFCNELHASQWLIERWERTHLKPLPVTELYAAIHGETK